MAKNGMFITFEGGEGSGKTTQVQRLVKSIKDLFPNQDLVITREPGGVSAAELIRNLLVSGDTDKWRPVTEALLMSAARYEHVEAIIRPALQRNKVVISDRFSDSTYVYQGLVGGVALRDIKALNQLVCDSMQPDLTIILDLDSRTGLTRAQSRGIGEDRFEAKGLAYHQKVRSGFVGLAKTNPDRCILINADRSQDQVADDILATVLSRFTSKGMVKHG